MLLAIHAGTHKTASTFLQHVLLLNRDALAARNIYFEPDAKLTASHGTAWMALLGNVAHVEAHVRQAVRAKRDKLILSSEDFEALIFDTARARAVEDAARAGGADAVEWHFVLRDPGQYFASMYAELTKHLFVDHLTMFATALRDGKFRIDREANRYPRYWEFVFDYETHLKAFAAGIGGKVLVHDFRAPGSFPGQIMLADITGTDFDWRLPGAGSRNARLSPDEIVANRRRWLHEIAEGKLSAGALAEINARLASDAGIEAECTAAISNRFAPGMERILSAGLAK